MTKNTSIILNELIKEKQKIESINNALIVGEMSGDPVSFDNEKFKERMRIKLAENT